MSKQRINLSLHLTAHHKSYLLQDDQYTPLADRLLHVDKHLHPTDNKNEMLLFDMDTMEILEVFENIENATLDHYAPENLILSSFFSTQRSPVKIPKSVEILTLDGGSYMQELMSQTEKSSKVWDELIYESLLGLFNKTVEERIERDNLCRTYYTGTIKKLNLYSPVSLLLSQLKNLNITLLSIIRTYLSEKDLYLLSEMKQLNQLGLQYIYNDCIPKLPPNLKILTVSGSYIENLGEINMKGLPLEQLSLESNCIKNIDGISKFRNLTVLSLDDNLLRYFDLNFLPAKIEILSLDKNILENDFFEGHNSTYRNKAVKRLALSNNSFTVNPWLLNRLNQTFPMLEYLDISNNYADGVPDYVFINDEESSSIASIRFWLETQDYKYTDSYQEVQSGFNYYSGSNSIVLKWEHESLPAKLILSDIQYRFSSFFELMPQFKLYREGVYCDIDYDGISLVIREESTAIYLEFYTSESRTLNDYFYKYFEEINSLVKHNTHHPILPAASFSQSCGIYEKFFKFIFQIDKKILDNPILIPNAGEPMALISTQKKGSLSKNSNKPSNHYKKLKQIAFIIITSRDAFPYLLDENNRIYNRDHDDKKQSSATALELSLKEGADKKNYLDTLTNAYLGSDLMEQAAVSIKGDSRYKMNILFNSRYFYADSNNLFLKSSDMEMSNTHLHPPKIKEGKTGKYKKITVSLKNGKIYIENIKCSGPTRSQ